MTRVLCSRAPQPPLLLFDVRPKTLSVTVTMVILFTVYPDITRQSLLMLHCVEIEGTKYLTADMSIRSVALEVLRDVAMCAFCSASCLL
jgi:hypothetical protein